MNTHTALFPTSSPPSSSPVSSMNQLSPPAVPRSETTTTSVPALVPVSAPAPEDSTGVPDDVPQRFAGVPSPLLHFPPGYSPGAPGDAHPAAPPKPLSWQDKLERRLSRVCSWVPFVFVCIIMLWSIYAFVFHVGPLMDGVEPTPSFPFKPPSQSPATSAPSPSAGPASSTGTFNSERIAATVVVGLFWFLTCWSYLKVVFTKPGSPKSVLSLRPSLGRPKSPSSGSIGHNGNMPDTTIVPIHEDEPDNVPMGMLNGSAIKARVGQGGGTTEESVPLVPIMSSRDPALVPSIATKRNGDIRFCRKCDMPKPDRAHHCRICNQCVLKMDHHCPWVAGCVGFGNYKFFLLFLFYLSLYCLTTFGFTVNYFFVALATGPSDQFVTASHILGLTLCSLLFGLTLFGFFCYHVSLVLANQTTIEAMETQRYDHSRVLVSKPPSVAVQGAAAAATTTTTTTAIRQTPNSAAHINPFDLGWRRNFTQVFGPACRWWMWFVPVASHQGDGITFPVALFEVEHAQHDQEHVHQLA